MASLRPFLVAWGIAASAMLGCGTDATGIEACRSIEQARCRKAPACPALGVAAGLPVEECVAAARDRCLHGLAVVDPGPNALHACVQAIDDDSTCTVVSAPETAPACSFLLTSPPSADAGVDSPATDSLSTTPDAAGDGG